MIPKYLKQMYAYWRYQCRSSVEPVVPTPALQLYPAQKEWVDWCFEGGERLLLGARGYGKTESILLVGLLEKILQNKKLTTRIYSRNYEDAQDLLRVLGNLLKQAGCSGTFNTTQIVLKENPSKEPTVSLKSILARGHKGKHVDWVIFDDPVDLMDEFSPPLLKRVSTIYQNLSSIAKQGVITIGQYVCSGDLYTQLEKTIPTRGYWHGDIPELDTDLQQLRSTGKSEHFIHANYLGTLLPSVHHPFEKLRIGDFGEHYDYACLDPSLTGKDYTALAMMRLENNRILARIYLWKASYIDCFESILQVLKKSGVGTLSYEDNIIGDAAYFTFQKIEGIRVYPFRSTKNKVQKIALLEPLLKPNEFTSTQLYLDQGSHPVALDQIRFWNPLTSQHDDAPDSLAMLLQQEGLLPKN